MSGNITLYDKKRFRIGLATATNDGKDFVVTGLKTGSLQASSLSVDGVTMKTDSNTVQFVNNNGETLDIAASEVVFGNGTAEATMKIVNDQVVFVDEEGNLMDVGDPIIGDIEMPLEVIDGEEVKFAVTSDGDTTTITTTDNEFAFNKNVNLLSVSAAGDIRTLNYLQLNNQYNDSTVSLKNVASDTLEVTAKNINLRDNEDNTIVFNIPDEQNMIETNGTVKVGTIIADNWSPTSEISIADKFTLGVDDNDIYLRDNSNNFDVFKAFKVGRRYRRAVKNIAEESILVDDMGYKYKYQGTGLSSGKKLTLVEIPNTDLKQILQVPEFILYTYNGNIYTAHEVHDVDIITENINYSTIDMSYVRGSIKIDYTGSSLRKEIILAGKCSSFTLTGSNISLNDLYLQSAQDVSIEASYIAGTIHLSIAADPLKLANLPLESSATFAIETHPLGYGLHPNYTNGSITTPVVIGRPGRTPKAAISGMFNYMWRCDTQLSHYVEDAYKPAEGEWTWINM